MKKQTTIERLSASKKAYLRHLNDELNYTVDVFVNKIFGYEHFLRLEKWASSFKNNYDLNSWSKSEGASLEEIIAVVAPFDETELWELISADYMPVEIMEPINGPAFLQGFVEGLLSRWSKLKGEL